MKDWVELQKALIDKPKIIINCENATGTGDKIHITPAIRECKKQNPDKEIIVMIDKSPDVFNCNPHISYVLPAYTTQIKYRNNYDKFIYLNWSFYEHHQYDHIVAAYFKYIVQDFGIDKYDYSMEMFCNIESKLKIDEIVSNIKHKYSKPIIAISPAYTFRNRMLPEHLWQELVNKLKDEYTIISFGCGTDFNLTNVIDMRTKFKVNEIPYFIDQLDMAISINSGFLNILACTKKVKIIHLNIGEFPKRLFDPVRNDVLGWNCVTISHDCPLVNECFAGHITESIFQEQLSANRKLYEKDYNLELIKKYTAHNYCAKKTDKYSCSKLVFDNFKI